MSTGLPSTCYGDLIRSTERNSTSIPSKCCGRTSWESFIDTEYSLTQATDTTNIRLVFAAVKETILQNALKDSGIL